jgi:plastocyanin
MQIRKFAAVMLLVPFAAACGGAEEAPEPAAPSAPAETAAAPDLSNAGGIDGTAMFVGEAPAADTIQMAADPFCQSAHSDAVMSSPVLADADGGLMNVVVHISSGLDGYAFDAAMDQATLNQSGCMYDPHILAVQAGQGLIIRNSDDTLHNVNVQPANNAAFNQGQPLAGMEISHTFDNAEVGIPARCDVHPWMGAFISVFEHPYFAVSTTGGAFAIPLLPAGDYVVEAWHETLGTLTQSVTITANETSTVDFEFGG